MGHRLSKIYTRQGDAGQTRMANGDSVSKAHPRIIASGYVDELNSSLGLLLAEALDQPIQTSLTQVQHRLFELGGELSLPDYPGLTAEDTQVLEQAIDALNQQLPPLKEFILPGGGRAAALAHQARCICRRSESALVALHELQPQRAECLSYLNRLSDLLFVIARILARQQTGGEPLWQPRQ